MKTLLFLLLLASPIAAQDSGDLLRRAELLYDRGSFEEAHKLYQEADGLDLEPGPARYVDFRLADSNWRSAAASRNPDSSRLDGAREALNELLEAYPDKAERDETWADVQESLGDYFWDRAYSHDYHSGWNHYSEALGFWAGSRDLDRARERYLAIVSTLMQPGWWGERSYASYSNRLDLRTLERAAKIATSEHDRGWTGFFLGYARSRSGQSHERVVLAAKDFEGVLALGPENPWRDDALYHYGLFLEEKGEIRYDEDGNPHWKPDYLGAVQQFRRLVEEADAGESRYYKSAHKRISAITGAAVSIGVDRFFVPGSEAQYRLNWRNVDRVSLSLVPIDLTRDIDTTDRQPYEYADGIQIGRTAPVSTWTFETGDEGEHRPGDDKLTIAERPAAGAYMLIAEAKGETSRSLVLVSDVLLSTKGNGSKTLGWLTDLETGAPVAEARIFFWERYYDEEWRTRSVEGVTAADGTVLFEREQRGGHASFFMSAVLGDRQVFSTGDGYGPSSSDGSWKLYAHSDRPAYRPEDEVRWKLVTRVKRGEGYETPADQEFTYKVLDPRGAVIDEGQVTLNAYGAAWGSLTTTPTHPLGMYSVQLWRGDDRLTQAQLFRLEEYKLPEFEVSVSLPDDPERPGQTKLFRLGDEVEAVVQADYYYGGAVAGAEVEVLVYQRPYYHTWTPRREYPWYYTEGSVYRGWWGGPGQLVSQETYTADALGRVVVPIQTPAGSAQDLEYTVEARVVDASRREVVSQDTLRVTRQAYYVQVETTHSIHEPGDRVELEFTAQDANKNPIAAAGEVVVTRDTWVEIWEGPDGREYRDEALAELRREHPIFPPPGKHGWFQAYNGYEREEVERTRILIGPEGEASWKFPAQREGYYTVAWTSEDDRHQRIHAQTAFWVATDSSRDLGYRQGGVEIIVDKDTFRVGEPAAVMLAASKSDRYVLFTIEGEDLHHFEVVHLKGTVKLVTLDIDSAHVPNIFLGALMVSDRQTWWDQEEIVVPPEAQFLDIDLVLDKPGYEPGETGTVTVTVTDHLGQPVEGEVSLAVYDAALAAIQGEIAGDPRQFFFGERNNQYVRTSSTLSQRSFQRLIKNEQGDVVDEAYAFLGQGRYRGPSDGAALLEEAGSVWSTSDRRFGGRSIGIGGGGGFAGGEPSLQDAEVSSEGPSSPVGNAVEKLGALGYLGSGVDKSVRSRQAEGGQAFGDLATVEVRTDFRDTAVWAASVVTDAQGRAVIDVPYPQSTTRWTAMARAFDTGTRVGMGEAVTHTRQPLIARLQSPRFLQVGDEVTISANLNNNTDKVMPVLALLEVEGVELLGLLRDGELLDPETGSLQVAAGGQERVDWLVRVTAPGSALLRLKAVSPEHSDGMERRLPVEAHGIEVLLARAGKMTGDELALAIDLPGARADGTTSLSVQLTPSLAVTMLDALPYLVDYPYGCTEQTLSRFLPAVVVARTLREFDLDAETAMGRVFGGIEREHVGGSHPDGPGPIDRLDDVVARGLERLYDFQHSDGGWAWWKTGDSDHWMSAYVMWGLTLAQEAGVEVRASVLDGGRKFLELELVERELDTDVQAWMLFALARRLVRDEATSDKAEVAFKNLWSKRDGLNAYTRSLFALAAHDLGHADEAAILVENLANGVIRDDSPDTSVVLVGEQSGRDDALKTAHWGEDGVWSRWSEGGVEATAFALRAMMAIDPDHELVQPTLNWLVQNRRAGQWSNTRDTSIVVLALNDYLEISGELASDVAFDLSVNGRLIASKRLTKEELLAAPSVFDVDPALLRDGSNQVRVVRREGGPLYFAAHARFFSQEEPIPARGTQLFVRREYYRLKPVPTLLEGVIYEKERLYDGASVMSGDRIEVVLTAEAKNHLEYLVFEDLKPAGFEAVEVQSGKWLVARQLKASEVERRFVEDGRREEVSVPGSGKQAYGWRAEDGYTGRTRGLHQELRDRKVALFADRLPEGVWEMRYELRAETPGKFHALPVLGQAMYVPEIRCNSNELRVEVLDDGAL